MGAHIIDGQFQSDKYPTTPRGKVPLSVEDPTAQALLWRYAQIRRGVDAEFADDLEACLRAAGYEPEADNPADAYVVTDAVIHPMALTLRSWLPGDLLLGPVERALREALKGHGIAKERA